MKPSTTENNLVGYLLKALDPDEHREVEDYLRTHPEARNRLERLRRALAPLASDADGEPPPGLWVGALAKIAEHQCRKLPPAPAPPPAQAPRPARRWWRRADLLVAAALLLCVLGLSLPWLGRLWHDHQVIACKDNLRLYHQGLVAYADHRNGALPEVKDQGPHSFAGVFVPALNDAGVLHPDVSVACPGREKRRPPPRHTLGDLKELWHRLPEHEFRALTRDLAGCYAYTLGYVNGDGPPVGLRLDSGDYLPVMADGPPPRRGRSVGVGNSPNHAGTGQNVLFLDGSVRFVPDRAAGVNGDDIYLNRDNRVAPGRDRTDTVLGASGEPHPDD